jgi:AMP-binding enzyme C-terminal domain
MSRGLPNEGSIVRSERRTYRLFKTLSIDFDRICECTQPRFGRVRHVPDHLRLRKERIVKGLRDIQNRRDRQYAVELIEPAAGRLLSKFAIQNLRQFVTIDVAQGQRAEPLVRLPVRGGAKISPLELDCLLAQHPAVAGALTVGVPDPLMGERIHALVVPRSGAEIDEAELRIWVAGRIDRFKQPDTYHFGSELPTGRTGKVDRGALRKIIGNVGP